MKTRWFAAALAAALICAAPTWAVTTLGNGTAALLDNDLTDPEQDGNDSGAEDADGNGLFNAIFFSSVEPTFSNATAGGPSEAAFDLFDQKLGAGEAKFCCNGGTITVGADFRTTLASGPGNFIQLTHFTISSDNDSGIQRDPDVWFIEGSNDDVVWTPIFSYLLDGNSPFDDFGGSVEDRVLRYDVGTDFATPDLYKLFRFRSTSYGSQNVLGLGELEFFGNLVHIPEPASISLLALSAAMLLRRRRAA